MSRPTLPAAPRRRHVTFAVLALAGAVVVVGCAAREPGADTGITTIRSGTPGGARVTAVSDDDRAMRVSTELCQRESTCGRIGDRDDQRWRSDEACLADLGARVPGQIRGWTCAPAASRARVEDCLAAIRSASCATRIERPDALPPCRADVVCAD